MRRFAEPGALTAPLNCYRALALKELAGPVNVPTLYIWGSDDMALGEKAALQTAGYVEGKYSFERLEGKSRWLIEEVPELVTARILQHLRRVA